MECLAANFDSITSFRSKVILGLKDGHLTREFVTAHGHNLESLATQVARATFRALAIIFQQVVQHLGLVVVVVKHEVNAAVRWLRMQVPFGGEV
jgi:hypothetical protein